MVEAAAEAKKSTKSFQEIAASNLKPAAHIAPAVREAALEIASRGGDRQA